VGEVVWVASVRSDAVWHLRRRVLAGSSPTSRLRSLVCQLLEETFGDGGWRYALSEENCHAWS
jgi:hypothetical protein